MTAIAFHSRIATHFHASYTRDANRLERLGVWKDFIGRYAQDAKFAYDIGCGSGILACELAGRGIRTIAIDGSAEMLAIARQLAAERGLPQLDFQQHFLPIANIDTFAQADIIIASSVFEYLESVTVALASASRMLHSHGILLFSMSNCDSLSRKLVRCIHRLTGRPQYLQYLHHFMTPDTINTALNYCGFEQLEYAYCEHSDRFNRLFSRFLPQKFSSNMLLIAARKKA